jgi:hypothetical protein
VSSEHMFLIVDAAALCCWKIVLHRPYVSNVSLYVVFFILKVFSVEITDNEILTDKNNTSGIATSLRTFEF